MSPTFFVVLPFTLMLLLAKGVRSNQTKSDPPTAAKVMGLLTENGNLIPLTSIMDNGQINADGIKIVIE